MRVPSYRHYGDAMDRGLRQADTAEPTLMSESAVTRVKQYTIDFAKNTITDVKHFWVDAQGNIVDPPAAP